MKTQCPECKNIFKAPDAYEKLKINCPKCKGIFYAEKYVQPVNPEAIIKPATPAKPVIIDFIICPNSQCGYKGSAKKESRANIGIGIFWGFLFPILSLLWYFVNTGDIIPSYPNNPAIDEIIGRSLVGFGCFLYFGIFFPIFIYFMATSGHRYLCPQCGMQIRSDN